MITPGLSRHVLWISDPTTSLDFYQRKLGMTLIETTQSANSAANRYRLAFSSGATCLELHHRKDWTRPTPSDDEGYWKIGITLPDVDLARQRLMDVGINVTEPRQFRDIGYLCHLQDPDGHAIELLQHRFEWNHQPTAANPSLPLGCTLTFGQVTLRIKDPKPSLRFYTELLGMQLLSRQIVEPYRFTLYFLAHTDERPPAPDIDAVENREWLWQRPYTTLELQHVWGTESTDMRYQTQSGFDSLCFSISDVKTSVKVLMENNILLDKSKEPGSQDTITILDPDGYRIHLSENHTC